MNYNEIHQTIISKNIKVIVDTKEGTLILDSQTILSLR